MKFNKDSTHTTYFNSFGIEVPSATTVLKILNKPALIKWANFLGFNGRNVDDVLKETATRGSIVHDLISAYLAGHLIIYVPDPDNQVSASEISAYIKSFKEWLSKHTVAPILLEKKFSSDKFGGTIDFYGIIDGQYTLLDFKTAKKIRLSMFLQLALYCILLEENGYKIDRVGILLVNPNHKDDKYITRSDMDPYIIFVKKLLNIFHCYYELNQFNNWNEDIF